MGLQARKDANDPTLSDEAKEMKKLGWDKKDAWLVQQSKNENPKVFLINEWKHKHFQKVEKCQTRTRDETWWFGRKAKYAQDRDKDGNILKYHNCSWNRIFCDLCPTVWCCHSSSSFGKHLKSHAREAAFLDLKDKEVFCRVTGLDIEKLADDPDSIDSYAALNKLVNEYHLILDNTQQLTKKKPTSLAKCGDGVKNIFEEALMELIVGLHSTPSAAQTRTLRKFINVCINYFFYNI